MTDPADWDHERTHLEQLISGEVDYLDIHARRVLSDGTPIELASHRVALRDPDATLECIITVARPIHTPNNIPHLEAIAGD